MEKKAAIIKLVKSGRSQADVSKEFGISKQTFSDFLRNKNNILEATEKPSGGGFATTNVFLQGVASMPGGSMRLPQQQPHLAASSSDTFEGQPFHSNPFLSPVAQPANIPQLQQQMASLQLAHQGHTLSTNLWH
ncbi:hypothetical protein MRX96_013920 [Rhipicephalus microplus]